MTTIRGFADLHTHPMAHRGFGGEVLVGEPFDARGIHAALRRCDQVGRGHDPLSSAYAFLSSFIRQLSENHGPCGAPSFENWPLHTTIYHQQMYVTWLRRAHAHGLRLLCALAVNNELLARTAGAVRYSEYNMVESQVRGIKQLVATLRAQSDAANEPPWIDIAETPAEARAIIGRGELAVVLGIEVDTLESLARHTGNDEPNSNKYGPSLPTKSLRQNPFKPSEVDALLDCLQNFGISMMTPVHLADNSFGGAAIYDDRFDLLQEWLRGTPYPEMVSDSVAFRLGEQTKPLERFAMRKIAGLKGNRAYAPTSGDLGHRSSTRLSALGREFLIEAMKRGFIIDVDHMSEKTTDDALSLAMDHDYPVISSHSAFKDLGYWRHETTDKHGLVHEGMKTAEQVELILNLGGLVAPITNQHRCKQHGNTVTNGVGSSRAYAQAFLYAVERATQLGRGGVALGTDFNGLAQQPGPRFPAEVNQHPPLQYGPNTKTYFTGQPLIEDVLAGRARGSFNLNRDGLAHYGMLADFIEELRTIHVPESAIDVLFNSAEAFVQMWERCESRATEMNLASIGVG